MSIAVICALHFKTGVFLKFCCIPEHVLLFSALFLFDRAYKKGKLKLLWMLWAIGSIILFDVVNLWHMRDFFFEHNPFKPFPKQISIAWRWHIIIIIQYAFYSVYYIRAIKPGKWRIWAGYTIPVFAILSLVLSYFNYQFSLWPVINMQIEGILLFLMFTHLLFNINTNTFSSIYADPDLWLAVGIMLYFGCQVVLADIIDMITLRVDTWIIILQSNFQQGLTDILYGCFFIASICTYTNKN